MPRHRGRPSHDEQVETFIALIRADIWTLKEQKSLTDALGVKALATEFSDALWPLGIALHLLIAGAVSDVSVMAAASGTRTATRVVAFLRLWYDEHLTVAAVARQLGLSRSHVAKTIQRPALLLVAQRMLALMHHTDPASQSAGVQRAVQQFKKHAWSGETIHAAGVSCQAPCSTALSA